MVRLNKLLQGAGAAARRKADLLIKAGRVRVNHVVVREPWREVDPERDIITLDDRRIRLASEKHYFKLYKPRGVTSTLQDRHAARTLAEFIPPGLRLFPIGRLDRESEGLLILTDDGELALRLSHPRYRVPKRYRVELDRPLTARDLERLKGGLTLEDGPFRPHELRPVDRRTVELALYEGRKREIRRGFSALGYRVIRLVRLAIGPISLGDLEPGELRPLNAAELESLQREGWLAELSLNI